jgi:hypothetical protein
MGIRGKVAGLVPLVSLVALLGILAAGLVWAAGPPSPPPGLDRALAAQAAHTDALLANPRVVGTAIGLGPDGRAVVKIYTRAAGVRGLPAALDGVPVEVEATGDLVAQDVWKGIGGSSGTERLIVLRRSLYCTVGTLGALVRDGAGTVYALSNAHVYAGEGSKLHGGPALTGDQGDRILQPGRVDMTQAACGSAAEIDAAEIGRLWAYRPIVFSRTAKNRIDAAIAKVSVDVANSTVDGLGTPAGEIVDAALAQAVVKYGRTTGRTEGTVTGINATVIIKYDKGQARFEGQVVVRGLDGSSFSAGGDSGSLIMTSDENRPVALLFAGSSSSTIGNPIRDVLAEWGLSIVDTP